MENLGKNIQKPKFNFKERHILWNWQTSPDDNTMGRYHFVIADDRFIESKVEKIISNFQNGSIINCPFEEIRKIKGDFKEAGLKYLFVSYDSKYSPQLLNFKGVSTNYKRDSDLRERKGLSIEDYVLRLYEQL